MEDLLKNLALEAFMRAVLKNCGHGRDAFVTITMEASTGAEPGQRAYQVKLENGNKVNKPEVVGHVTVNEAANPHGTAVCITGYRRPLSFTWSHSHTWVYDWFYEEDVSVAA